MTMKTSLYDRIPTIETDLLIRMRDHLCVRIEMRDSTPRRHDYLGKCLIGATLELERRGVLPLPKNTIRKQEKPHA